MYTEKEFYLTRDGLKKAKREYEELFDLRKKKSNGDAPELLHSEDLNPEYLSYLEDIELLENRIAELEDIIKNAKIISSPTNKKDKEKVGLGSFVSLEVDGIKDDFQIVGTFEANPSLGRISNESPVGKALIGKKEGEEIILSSPIKTRYKIKKIKY